MQPQNNPQDNEYEAPSEPSQKRAKIDSNAHNLSRESLDLYLAVKKHADEQRIKDLQEILKKQKIDVAGAAQILSNIFVEDMLGFMVQRFLPDQSYIRQIHSLLMKLPDSHASQAQNFFHHFFRWDGLSGFAETLNQRGQNIGAFLIFFLLEEDIVNLLQQTDAVGQTLFVAVYNQFLQDKKHAYNVILLLKIALCFANSSSFKDQFWQCFPSYIIVVDIFRRNILRNSDPTLIDPQIADAASCLLFAVYSGSDADREQLLFLLNDYFREFVSFMAIQPEITLVQLGKQLSQLYKHHTEKYFDLATRKNIMQKVFCVLSLKRKFITLSLKYMKNLFLSHIILELLSHPLIKDLLTERDRNGRFVVYDAICFSANNSDNYSELRQFCTIMKVLFDEGQLFTQDEKMQICIELESGGYRRWQNILLCLRHPFVVDIIRRESCYDLNKLLTSTRIFARLKRALSSKWGHIRLKCTINEAIYPRIQNDYSHMMDALPESICGLSMELLSDYDQQREEIRNTLSTICKLPAHIKCFEIINFSHDLQIINYALTALITNENIQSLTIGTIEFGKSNEAQIQLFTKLLSLLPKLKHICFYACTFDGKFDIMRKIISALSNSLIETIDFCGTDILDCQEIGSLDMCKEIFSLLPRYEALKVIYLYEIVDFNELELFAKKQKKLRCWMAQTMILIN